MRGDSKSKNQFFKQRLVPLLLLLSPSRPPNMAPKHITKQRHLQWNLQWHPDMAPYLSLGSVFFFQSFGNSFFTERHNEVTPPIEAEYNPGDLIRNLGPSSTYTGSILAEGSSFFFCLRAEGGPRPNWPGGSWHEKRFLPGCYKSVPFGATCLNFSKLVQLEWKFFAC